MSTAAEAEALAAELRGLGVIVLALKKYARDYERAMRCGVAVAAIDQRPVKWGERSMLLQAALIMVERLAIGGSEWMAHFSSG